LVNMVLETKKILVLTCWCLLEWLFSHTHRQTQEMVCVWFVCIYVHTLIYIYTLYTHKCAQKHATYMLVNIFLNIMSSYKYFHLLTFSHVLYFTVRTLTPNNLSISLSPVIYLGCFRIAPYIGIK
jgi:hypothetical protein